MVGHIQRRFDRSGIERAHQAADVLHLAPPCSMAGDPLRVAHRREQDRRQFKRIQSDGGQIDQRRAQLLQLFDMLLFLRPADDFGFHRLLS